MDRGDSTMYAIRKLTPLEVRHIVHLHKVRRLSHKEIGRKLDITPCAVELVVTRKIYAWVVV